MPLFAIALASYAFFYQAGGWNQNARFDLTRALVERGSARIDAYAYNTGDRACLGPDGRCVVARAGVDHYYSDKAPGVSWLALPVYALAWSLRDGAADEAFLATSSWLATVFAIGLPSALGVVALWALLGALALPERPRAALCLAYAFGTLAFPYATLLYGHQLAASLALCAFALLARGRDDAEGPAPKVSLAAGLCLGGAVAVEYPAALFAGALLVYAATRPWRDRRRALLTLAAGGALPILALAAYHAAHFGGPFTTAYAFSTQPHRGAGAFMGMGWPRPEALWGLSFSPHRGLFFSAPWLLLALPGWALLWRRARAETAVCVVVAAGFAWLNVSLLDWEGGWAPGPRYLVPSLPCYAVGAAGLFLAWPQRGRRALWLVFAATALVSVLLMLTATSVKPEVAERIARPHADFLLPRFMAGELALSTQSFDMAVAPVDAPRRAWNLGQQLGLEGLASLAPLAAIWAACLGWLSRTLRS